MPERQLYQKAKGLINRIKDSIELIYCSAEKINIEDKSTYLAQIKSDPFKLLGIIMMALMDSNLMKKDRELYPLVMRVLDCMIAETKENK